ncbi:hypothetical protein A4L30_10640 [Salmonella enterica subsp. enterica serovar Bovismorbificans]|nr:hypothetical protein [Salmonella enterica subsp. enterica serovar Bovismorbificans]
MNEELTLTELAKFYGFTQPAVRKWVERGMPYNTNTRRCPKEKAVVWINENILNPLKQTSVKEEIDRAKLRRELAVAAQEETKVREQLNNLIPVAYVETVLTAFCSDIRQSIMQIPAIHSLELLEAASDQRTLKEALTRILSERLNEIGEIMLSPEVDDYDDYSEDGEIEESIESEISEEFDV